MPAHINADGKFQSDKYPTTPAGKVPLSCADVTAQDLLWEYARRREKVDAEFAQDLRQCLRAEGFPKSVLETFPAPVAALMSGPMLDGIRKIFGEVYAHSATLTEEEENAVNLFRKHILGIWTMDEVMALSAQAAPAPTDDSTKDTTNE